MLFIGNLACQANHSKEKESNNYSNEDTIFNTAAEEIVVLDTIIIQTAEAFNNHIRSNRVLLLKSKRYLFKSTLIIDHIHNLKIIGTDSSELMVEGKNQSVLQILNSSEIKLDHLIIGHKECQNYQEVQGALRVSHSDNINIFNCKIFGAGTFGFVSNDVENLRVSHSAISLCSALIFELSKSENVIFENTKFHDNDLAISVLGGFTNSTKDINFVNCEFLNNKPAMTGNPAFNFFENDKDFDEKINFTNCTFKKNKGYKWYGDKIKLENCVIDSFDFTGLEAYYQKIKKDEK